MDFKTKLAHICRDKRYRKATLARALGIHPSMISHYASGEKEPTWDRVVALAKATDTTAEWLIDDTQDWPPPHRSGRLGSEWGPKVETHEITEDEWSAVRYIRANKLTYKQMIDRLSGKALEEDEGKDKPPGGRGGG